MKLLNQLQALTGIMPKLESATRTVTELKEDVLKMVSGGQSARKGGGFSRSKR